MKLSFPSRAVWLMQYFVGADIFHFPSARAPFETPIAQPRFQNPITFPQNGRKELKMIKY